MPEKSHHPGRMVLEGLVVLLSILVAFFLEGWRADRELARELDQELVSVRVELQRNRELIAAEVESLRRVEGAGSELLELLGSSSQSNVAVSDTLAFLAAQWHPSFSPSLGAVTALISSGRLAQVEDQALRLGLAGLSSLIDDALEEELFARQIGVEQLLPMIGEAGGWETVTEVALSYFGLEGSSGLEGLTPQERNLARAIPSFGSVPIPNSPGVRAALSRKVTWIAAARAEFTSLDSHLADLIGLIPLDGT